MIPLREDGQWAAGEGQHPADSEVLVTGPDVGGPRAGFLGVCISV